MRDALFEPKAAKQTVSVTLNSDLYARAKSVGINVSAVAEQAVAVAYVERLRETLSAQVQVDLAALEQYAEEHGTFADLVREHYGTDDAV